MSYNNHLEKYFLSKNLDVSFNTLGANTTLTNLFIKENQDIVQNVNQSNYIKHQCYNRYYKIEPRTKFTGFEKYQKLDKNIRFKMAQHVSGLQGIFELKAENIYTFGSYLTELKESFKKFNNPILYLSGGIDSEFVALAMIDAGIKFTPVIFQWVDDNDDINNLHDITYALDFCLNHNLIPIIRKVNLEKLWINPEFELLAKETNISSPQVNTYVYMIESMAVEYPNSTHVLGGEVRFKTQYDVVENKFNNFVLAAKVPAGELYYNGLTYILTQNVNYATANTNSMGLSLTYTWDGDYTQNQLWYVTGYVNGSTPQNPTGASLAGAWFYGGSVIGTGFDYSTDLGNNWTTLPIGTTTIVGNTMSGGGGDSVGSGSGFTIKLRQKSNPGIVITSTVTFTLVYNYIATLATYTPGGVTSWTRPNSLVTKVSVGAGGGGGGGGGVYRIGNGGGPSRYWGAGSGGGGGGSFNKLQNVVLSATEPQVTFSVGAGGIAGTATPLTDGGDASSSVVTIKSSTGDLTVTGYGGTGGKANPTADPTVGQFGAGGDAGNGINLGSTGTNVVSGGFPTNQDAYAGGGGGEKYPGGTNPVTGLFQSHTFGGTYEIYTISRGGSVTPNIFYGKGAGGGYASNVAGPGTRFEAGFPSVPDPGVGWGGPGAGIIVSDTNQGGYNGAPGYDGMVYIFY